MKRRYLELDVFGSSPGKGNPLGVVLDAQGLNTSEMQAFANWLNFSETTFVSDYTKDNYDIRIFTPQEELPFAGHPTIGTATALLHLGLLQPGEAIQHCASGSLPLRLQEDCVFVRTPEAKVIAQPKLTNHIETLVGIKLNHPPASIDVGPIWLTANLKNRAELLQVNMDFTKLETFIDTTSSIGLNLYALNDGQVFVRSFVPEPGIMEDPVCGSGNAAVAAHLRHTDGTKLSGLRYQARQGECVGRDGLVEISIEDQEIWLGGQAHVVVEGMVNL